MQKLFKCSQLENKINHLQKKKKKKIDVKSLKEDHKGSIKNNKLILKTQQGVRSEKVQKNMP